MFGYFKIFLDKLTKHNKTKITKASKSLETKGLNKVNFWKDGAIFSRYINHKKS
jgi:hypothetical protein